MGNRRVSVRSKPQRTAGIFRQSYVPITRTKRWTPTNKKSVRMNEADDPLHYAPSLIDDILRRRRQELATHTFSHCYCLEEGQTEEAFL